MTCPSVALCRINRSHAAIWILWILSSSWLRVFVSESASARREIAHTRTRSHEGGTRRITPHPSLNQCWKGRELQFGETGNLACEGAKTRRKKTVQRSARHRTHPLYLGASITPPQCPNGIGSLTSRLRGFACQINRLRRNEARKPRRRPDPLSHLNRPHPASWILRSS